MVEHLKFTVDDSCHDQRISKFLSKNYKHVIKSRPKLHRAFKRNEITINGQVAEETRVLIKGDIVEIKYDDSIEEADQMQKIPIQICYQDPYLAIVWKPSGQNFIMFEKAIRFNTAMKDLRGNREQVWCINDIQKAASGLILVAKTEETRDLLLEQYRNNEIQITMRVLCHGAIQTTNLDELFTPESRGKDEEDAEPIVPSHVLKTLTVVSQTPSNNAGCITRLDLELTTPLSSAKLKKLFFHQSDHPIIGNSKHTRTLKVNDKGLCAALTAISFTHPKLHTHVHVMESEPAKFGVLCDREARFHQLKADKDQEEIKHATSGTADGEGQLLLAYTLGQKQFCGHTFKVTTDCLIPRTSTESLVRAAVDVLLQAPVASRVIDVGCGCGNLLLSILIRVPSTTGIGIDISDGALRVAQENARRLVPDTHVEFRKQDMTTLDSGTDGVFDVLVCNPPYLDAGKVRTRKDHKDLVEQEPPEALFADNEGYHWYHVLNRVASSVVAEDGVVVLECGKGMLDRVREIWAGWEQKAVYKDAQGWDRCLVLKRLIK